MTTLVLNWSQLKKIGENWQQFVMIDENLIVTGKNNWFAKLFLNVF